jgi:hypothetical protein
VQTESRTVVHIKELGEAKGGINNTDITQPHLSRKAGLIILTLPSHTSAALQSLDRGIFGPFKTFLKEDANCWVNTHQNRKVTRMQLGILIGGA